MRKKFFIQSLKWFLPLLFITFINGKIFFTHSHLLDSSIVVHSHPFKHSEKSTHNHTSKELIAIEFHTQGYSTTSIVPIIEINSPLQYLIQDQYSYEDKNLFIKESNTNLLRAPPFYS